MRLLSPKELAIAIGVSESSVKRWVDDGKVAAHRTAGGHRRIALDQAIRFLRETGTPILRPDMLGLPDLDEVRVPGLPHVGPLLVDALRNRSSAYCRGLILSLYLDGHALADIFDGPVRAALESLGELWHDTPGGIVVEHRATQICLEASHQLRGLLPDTTDGPLAIGCAPPGDNYQLPTLWVAQVLIAEGYDAYNYGPELPIPAFAEAVHVREPAIAWISVSHCHDPQGFQNQVAALVAQAPPQTLVALGGRGLPHLDLPPNPNVLLGATLNDLAEEARNRRRAA